MAEKQGQPRPQRRISRAKLALCVLGVMVCMSLLAAAPPLKQNHLAGLSSAGRAKALGQADGPGQTVIPAYALQAAAAGQTGVAARQGNDSSMQGSQPQSPSPGSLTPVPPVQMPPPIDDTNPPVLPLPKPCYSCGGLHIMCPLTASICTPCGGPAVPVMYACLME